MEPIYVLMYRDGIDLGIIDIYHKKEDAIKALCEDVKNETLKAFKTTNGDPYPSEDLFIPGLMLDHDEIHPSLYVNISEDGMSASLSVFMLDTGWQIVKVTDIK